MYQLFNNCIYVKAHIGLPTIKNWIQLHINATEGGSRFSRWRWV